MDPILAAVLVYSAQIGVVVAAAAAAEALGRIASPGVRLAWWRVVAVACMGLPLFASPAATDVPVASVTFAVAPAAAPAVSHAGSAGMLPAPGTMLLWLLLAGVVGRLGWVGAGMMRLRQLRRESAIVTLGGDVETLRLAIAPDAEFRRSDRVGQPATFGSSAPVILLPPSFMELDPDAQRAVACHELLHVARGDWRWIVAEELARAVFWFHPAVWWLLDRIESSREQLVDRLVTARVQARQAYMRALLGFAGGRVVSPSTAFLRKRHLRARLLQLGKEPVMSPRRLAFTSVFLACVTAGAVAGAVRALPLEIPVLAQTASARLEIRLAERAPAPGLSEAVVPGSGDRLYLHPPLATGEHVATARVVDGNQGRLVEVTFTAQAASRLRAATQGHLGKPVAVVIDGRIVAAPVLRGPIEGSAVISGITADEAETLVRSLSPASSSPGAVYSIQPGVSPPVPLTTTRPSYTPQAMRERLEGTVTLSAVVRADGTVHDIQVVKSLDQAHGLDQQAIAALRDWRFRAGTRTGQPVAVRIMVEMEFTMRESSRQ